MQTLARPWALRAAFALLLVGAATAAVVLLTGRHDEGVSAATATPLPPGGKVHFRPVSRGHRPPVLGAAVNWELLRGPAATSGCSSTTTARSRPRT